MEKMELAEEPSIVPGERARARGHVHHSPAAIGGAPCGHCGLRAHRASRRVASCTGGPTRSSSGWTSLYDDPPRAERGTAPATPQRAPGAGLAVCGLWNLWCLCLVCRVRGPGSGVSDDGTAGDRFHFVSSVYKRQFTDCMATATLALL